MSSLIKGNRNQRRLFLIKLFVFLVTLCFVCLNILLLNRDHFRQPVQTKIERSVLQTPKIRSNYTSVINLNDENFVPMPCIEPNCRVECLFLYPNHKFVDKVNIKPLNEEEKQHLAIDMGTDRIVNQLLNEPIRPKLCTYKTPNKTFSVSYHPIVFGYIEHFVYKTIPKTVIIDDREQHVEQMCLPKKSKDFSDLIPGRRNTYRFHFGEELDYRRVYSSVYFAVTMKKSGWDCNRHYEIISTGSIPYFDNLEQAGVHTMMHLPKSILYEARSMVGVDRSKLRIDHSRFNKTQYNLLLHRLLYYGKYRLTTTKLVEYILNIVQYSVQSNGTVLFLSHFGADYMKDLMLHGFTQVFGARLRTYHAPSFLYVYPRERQWKDNLASQFFGLSLHAMGFGYALTLSKYRDLYERDRIELDDDDHVRENIAKQQYDLIVFGSIFRENRFFYDAIRYYNKSRVIVIDGEDEERQEDRSYYAESATYFLREIQNDCKAFS